MSRWKKFLLTINFLFIFGLICSYLAPVVSPEKFVYFTVFGLAFPFLLIPNIAFFIYWLVLRKKQFFFSMLVLIAGYYHISRFFQFTFFSQEIPENSIKVMSYNVRLFDLYNWTENKKTRNQILDFLKAEDPDVICFQEYFYTSGNHFDTRDTILEILGTQHYYEYFTKSVTEPKSQGGKSNFGSAIYSKFPIINKGVILFENDPTNNCLYTDIVAQKDTFRIFNAHLGSIRFQGADYEYLGGNGTPQYFEQKEKEQKILSRLALGFKKRVSQSEEVLQNVGESPYPTIVCADMNDTPISYTYGQFSKQLTDAFIFSGNGVGGTYVGSYPFLRIDYIWHDESLKSGKFVTHQHELSDHKAITCEIFK